MRILFTTPVLEHPAAGGPQLRIENSIKALSRICELDIVYRAHEPTELTDKTSNFFIQYSTEYHVLFRPRPTSTFLSLFEKILNFFFNTRCTKQVEFLLDHIDRRQIDILWFGFGNISYPLIKRIKNCRPKLKVVCDTDSVWSRYILRELPYADGIRKLRIWLRGQKKESEERAWVNLCDVTTAVSEVDAKYYRDIANEPKNIHLFSNVIDVASYISKPLPPINFKYPSIYLAGSFGYYFSPMDTAARWIVDEILPRVHKTYPNTHFYIVGRNSELSFSQIDSPYITVTGRVESVIPYLCNTDVALVPLKFESGTRFKILEGGACKVPLVSTTLGAEGIPVMNEEHILIADEAEEFANAIVRLLNDKTLANKLALNCHKLIIEQYSIDSLVLEAKLILEYLDHDRSHHQ